MSKAKTQKLYILVDELTKDVSLMVVDFADKDEVDERQHCCGKIKFPILNI
jgi:hypothetical protein